MSYRPFLTIPSRYQRNSFYSNKLDQFFRSVTISSKIFQGTCKAHELLADRERSLPARRPNGVNPLFGAVERLKRIETAILCIITVSY